MLLKAYLAANLIVVTYALYKDNKLSVKILKNFFGFLLYLISWIPIGIASLFKKDNNEWFHTPHSSDKNDF